MGNLFDGCGGREPEVKKTKEFSFDDEVNNIRYSTDYLDDEYVIEYIETKNKTNNTKIKTYDF
jgi:hypothetical protein